MSFGGGASPPPPPPPPPSPPTYASMSAPPNTTMGRLGLLNSSILSGSMGPADERSTQRKSLLGY